MAKEEMKGGEQQPEVKAQLTYEQLQEYAQEITQKAAYFKQQAEILQQQVIELSNHAMFKRLDYLFEVVKLRDAFSAEFVTEAISEIEQTISASEEEDKNQETKEE